MLGRSLFTVGRGTRAISIFVARDQANADRLREVIQAFGFGQTGITPEDFVKLDHVIQLGREPLRIDILTGISGVTFDEAWNSREQGKISAAAVFFISRDLLIKNKRAANRDKDKLDITLLEKTTPRRVKGHKVT